MALFGFFALVLVLIYWINRAVALFDQLIADGQSAWVFLELTALSLPLVIRLVMPIAAFAASLYVTNRLASDSELVVMQATGYSPYRLARPVVVFGLIATLLTWALSHYLVPASTFATKQRQAEISQNVTSRLLVEGTFLTPATGVTLYIRDISASGELLDIFLTDDRSDKQSMTYTATRAYLVKSDNGPQLVMLDGMAQTLRKSDERLLTTRFSEFAYDVGGLISTSANTNRRDREVPTLELIEASPALMEETGLSRADLRLEVHNRTTQGLLSLVGALLGFSALLVGGFSRFGVWKQMLGAIGLVIFINALETAMTNAAQKSPENWGLMYAPTLVGLGICAALLFWSAHPNLLRRRQKQEVTA